MFKNKNIYFLSSIVVLIIVLQYFNYNSYFHFLLVQSHYIIIILLVLFARKILFYGVGLITLSHIIADAYVIREFPTQAITESAVQFLTAILLYVILNQKQTLFERHETVIQATKAGTYEWDLVSNKKIYNDMWAEMIGYTLKEFHQKNKSWEDVIHQEDLVHANEALKKLLKKEIDVYNTKIRLRHKLGHYVWIRDQGEIVKWSKNNKPIKMAGTQTDISDEISLQEEVIQSRDLMKYIIEHNQSAVAVHDRDMKYIYVSQRYIDDYRVKEKDIIGKHHYDVFPDLPQKWRDVHKRVLEGEVLKGDRDTYLREDGRIDHTRWECRPWYEKGGSIGGLIVYTEVINDQIRREKELEESHLMLQKVMDSLPIGIAVNSVNPSVKFDYMNDNFPKIYGVERKDLEQNDAFWEVVYEDEEFRNELKQTVEADIQSGQVERMKWLDVNIVKKGKPIKYISAYAAPIENTDMLISTVIDVTAQNVRERQIRHISYHDFVTNIPNRRYFYEKFEEIDTKSNYPLSLLIMDLNGLKIINDAFGQEKGNVALKQIANLLTEIKRKDDIIAKIGGDEFAMLLPKTDFEALSIIKNEIQQKISNQRVESIEYSLAIGYAIKTDITKSIEDTMKIAEEEMYKKKVLEGRSMRNRAIMGILSVLTDKYKEEKIHSQRVSDYCVEIGKQLDFSKEELEELRLAGMLHDIGKISIPDEILDKPGKLTEQEWIIMKEHTIHGYNILRAADEYSNLALYALTHHERIDGKGYPKGLQGTEIPLYSRIIGVVDAYEAMTADRPYRKGMSENEAIKEIIRCSGSQFDKNIAIVFVEKVLNGQFSQK